MRRARAERPPGAARAREAMGASGHDDAAISTWLWKARRRTRFGVARNTLVRTGFYGLLGSSGTLLAARAAYRSPALRDAAVACHELPVIAAGVVALSCLVACALAYVLTRPSLVSVARKADRRLSLDDRLPSALESIQGRATLLSPLLIKDAAAKVRGIEPPETGPRVPSMEQKLLPLAIATFVAAFVVDVALPAVPLTPPDPVVQEEGRILEEAARRLEESAPDGRDARQFRSLLRKATDLAQEMQKGVAGPEDAAQGLAKLLEELTLRGLDTPAGADAGEGTRKVAPSERPKTDRIAGFTDVLEYGDELESIMRDVSSLRGREMSPDETAALAKKLQGLAEKAGEDSALGRASKRASEELRSRSGGGTDESLEEALEEFMAEAERSRSGDGLAEPPPGDAADELKEAIARAQRALEERLARTAPRGPGERPEPGEEDKGAGGEIGRVRRQTGAGEEEEDEERGLSLPGTEPGSQAPGPPAPRLESAGPVYPAESMPGEGDIGVTTVIGPGTGRRSTPAEGQEPAPAVEVEESAAVRERVPFEYRRIIEDYFR